MACFGITKLSLSEIVTWVRVFYPEGCKMSLSELEASCLTALNPAPSRECAKLLAQLGIDLSSSSDSNEVRTFDHVFGVLHRKGLTPAYLVELCHKYSDSAGGLSAKALAACFAASLYPEKTGNLDKQPTPLKLSAAFRARIDILAQAFGAGPGEPIAKLSEKVARTIISCGALSPDELDLFLQARVEPDHGDKPKIRKNLKKRLALFAHAYGTVESGTRTGEFKSYVEYAQARLKKHIGLSHEESLRLLRGLSGAKNPDHPAVLGEGDDLSVAALSICTLQDDALDTTWSMFTKHGDFISFLRTSIPCLPSSFCRSKSGAERPYWNETQSDLSKRFPTVSKSNIEKAIKLEQQTWKGIRKIIHGTGGLEQAEAFWEAVHDRLTSKYSYYSFRSRLNYWWGKVLKTFDFNNLRFIEIDSIDVEDSTIHISENLLRVYREGYRLIRYSFFAQPGKKPGKPINQAVADEHVRKAIDAIWMSRLERIAEGDDANTLSPEKIRTTMQDRFPHLTEDQFENWNSRLPRRFWAYSLSRLDGYSNSEIQQMPPPKRLAHGGARERPLEKEPAILPLASLARTAPPDKSLIWAFASKMIGPKGKKWDARYLVAELWWWLSFADGRKAIIRGLGRADETAQQAAREGPFREFLSDLRRIKTVNELRRYLVRTDLTVFEKHLREQIDFLVGAPGLGGWRIHSDKWNKFRVERHWYIPVWYLTIVERMDESPLLARLNADDRERNALIELSRGMRREQSKHATDAEMESES